MNQDYLMKHISYQLHTFVRRYTLSWELEKSFCARPDFCDDGILQHAFPLLSSKADTLWPPRILSVSGRAVYACIRVPKYFYLLGPVRFPDPVAFLHQTEQLPLEERLMETIPFCQAQDFLTNILLVSNLENENQLEHNDIILSNFVSADVNVTIQKHFSDMVFENQEYGKTHNPYDQEIREQSSIENGDIEQLKKSIEEDYPGELGTLSKDPLRQMKNLGIVIITLASRSAIRGGILPEIAFSLSDSYIQKIEDCKDIPTALHVSRSAEFHYAQMVRELLEQKAGIQEKEKNPYIHKCKNYIFTHLHEKIKVQEIADSLGIHENYLSGLFCKCEGISISEFIQKEKINLAKNLLIYSRYSFVEIASYLGYSSQSHLGKTFKRITGYTLRKFREQFGVEGFR